MGRQEKLSHQPLTINHEPEPIQNPKSKISTLHPSSQINQTKTGSLSPSTAVALASRNIWLAHCWTS